MGAYQIHPGKSRRLQDFTLRKQVKYQNNIPSMIDKLKTCEMKRSMTKSMKTIPSELHDIINNKISDILNVRDQHTHAKCKSTSHVVKVRKLFQNQRKCQIYLQNQRTKKTPKITAKKNISKV